MRERIPCFFLGGEPLVAPMLPTDPKRPSVLLWSKLFGLSVAIIHKNSRFTLILISLLSLNFPVQCISVSLSPASSSVPSPLPLISPEPVSFSLQGQCKPTVARSGLPEHAPMLLMPYLDPFLPLVLVELVLLQDPGKTVGSE